MDGSKTCIEFQYGIPELSQTGISYCNSKFPWNSVQFPGIPVDSVQYPIPELRSGITVCLHPHYRLCISLENTLQNKQAIPVRNSVQTESVPSIPEFRGIDGNPIILRSWMYVYDDLFIGEC